MDLLALPRRILLHSLQTGLPNHCYLCDTASAGFLCDGCCSDLPRPPQSCYACALPIKVEQNDLEHTLCGDCLCEPKPFERTIAAFEYRQPVDFLINRFKHKRHFASGDFLSSQLAAQVAAAYRSEPMPDLLIPVPLHWSRRWTRGFNQSELTAGVLRRQLVLPVRDCCRRYRRNLRQQGLKRRDRLRNLRGAFTVNQDLSGSHVALIDDVLTTGATVTELTRALKGAGAARVDIWVLARVG